MILHNGDVLFDWPLQSHVITAGWFYNDGSLHRALDFRAAVGTPVYAAEGGTVETAYRWNGRRTRGIPTAMAICSSCAMRITAAAGWRRCTPI